MAYSEDQSLGEHLKTQRESKSLSLYDLSRRTQISPEMLLAMEENRFASFSQAEFIPGYLQLYCRHLGIDKEEVLKRYQYQARTLKGANVAPEKRPFLFSDYNSPIRSLGMVREKVPSGGMQLTSKRATLMVFAVLFFFLLFYLSSEYDNGPDKIRSDTTDMTATKQAIQTVTPPSAPAANPVASQMSNQTSGSNLLPGAAEPQQSPGIPSASSPQSTAPEPEKKIKVIGNSDSKRYHLPGMAYYNKVAAYHRVVFFSEEEAIKAGYYKANR
jgi:cytoskeletal protein RodZ